MRLGTIGPIAVLALGLIGWLPHVQAQEPGKVTRIGILSSASATRARRNIDAFREGLRELGYVEGKNIVIEYRYANDQRDRLPELAVDLVDRKVDVILATGTRPVAAAGQATGTIPIVAGGAGDLVGTELVESLSQPGANVTGFTRMSTEVSSKRIALLKEAASKVSRVAVIWSTEQDQDELREMESAVRQSRAEIQSIYLRDPKEFQNAYGAMAREGADALVILHSGFTLTHRRQLAELAVSHQLPSMCETARWARSGCLMSYGPDLSNLYRRAATYVDKILRGARPADLPIQRPVKFNLVVNLKTASALGITIPSSVLYRAHEVIR